MTEIDFGTLTAAVLARMDTTESELTRDERADSIAAMWLYKGAVAAEIRRVFNEAEARVEPVREACPHCGATLPLGCRFCNQCGRPRTPEVMPGWLEDLITVAIAKETGLSPTDPQLKEQIARSREEDPEVWAALVERIWSATKA